MSNVNYGKKFANIRKENRLKQQELAEILNLSQQVVSNIERNVTSPDLFFLLGISKIYNKSIDDILGIRIKKYVDKYIDEIVKILCNMNEDDKKLCLSLINDVAKNRGNDND